MSQRLKFTLVELLVIIGVIAILISILLPSMTTAREKAKTAICLSNMKQKYGVTQAFMRDNGNKLPAISGVGNRFDDDHDNNIPTENKSGLEGPTQIMLYAQGLETAAGGEKLASFLCPSTREPFQNLQDNDLRRISYSFNLMPTKASSESRYHMSNPLKAIAMTKNNNQPNEVLMLSESDNVIGYVTHYTMTQETNPKWYGDLPYFGVRWHYRLDHAGPRNSKTLNNVYYDGHAKTLSHWTNVEEMDSTQWGYFNYPQ